MCSGALSPALQLIQLQRGEKIQRPSAEHPSTLQPVRLMDGSVMVKMAAV